MTQLPVNCICNINFTFVHIYLHKRHFQKNKIIYIIILTDLLRKRKFNLFNIMYLYKCTTWLTPGSMFKPKST